MTNPSTELESAFLITGAANALIVNKQKYFLDFRGKSVTTAVTLMNIKTEVLEYRYLGTSIKNQQTLGAEKTTVILTENK